jgi:hypothetical protein
MADKRDESDESESAAEGPLGSEEDTEKGEARPPGDEAEAELAAKAKPDASAGDDDEAAEADAESEDDAKSDVKPETSAKTKDRESEPEREASGEKSGDAGRKRAKKDKDKGGGGRWWLVLLAVLVVEFYVYGRNGDIEVCVGKQDVHDFSLIGQERTDENRWKFPRCEARVNLGLRSQYDELVEDATNVACRGATLFRNRGEGPQCVAGTDGWTKQVDTSYIWPWDSRYYEHLLWFLFD